MIKPEVNRKRVFLVAAGVVFVFAGFQVYWLLNNSQTIIAALSIFSSLGLVATLSMLARIDQQGERLFDESVGEQDGNSRVNAVDNESTTANSAICNVEADEYFMAIKEDLNQVDRLVSDAINNLVLNFGYINKLSKTHHDMVMAIEKMAAPEGNKQIIELLDKQMVIADKIEHELDAAITSLQFGDLVTQLIAHTKHQVEILNMVLQRIDRQADWKGQEKNVEEIQEGISRAVNIAISKSKRKPVVQQGMQTGDVELF